MFTSTFSKIVEIADLRRIIFVFSFCLFQSDIYFVSSAPVSSASNCSSRDTSSQSSPQTPTGYEMPVFPSPLGDGKRSDKPLAPILLRSENIEQRGVVELVGFRNVCLDLMLFAIFC